MIVAAVTLLCSISLNAQQHAPNVFLVDASTIGAARASHGKQTSEFERPFGALIREAQEALKLKPVSVMQKTQLPPSGDKHDYMSVAPYWWPDSTKPDGLPYIRRDGEVNPDRYLVGDRDRIGTMVASVFTLSLAYGITNDERYAAHATEFLRTWFLNPATRMNPNLNYAQAVRGQNEGRGTGIIDGYGLRHVVDAIGLLAGSRSWTAADQEGMKQWFSSYLDWLLNSKNGKDEAAAKNNHGTTYDVQTSMIALFLGKDDLAREIVRAAQTKRIARQIEPDGAQPLELVRTKSWNYSMLNLEALMQLAWIGDRFGENLWTYGTEDGRCMRKAIDYLLPAAFGKETWNSFSSI
ncbi:MAG: alginate lyase family protein [Ignavibacteriales bacterium]|nr:alginate lyase family protein [Ignavibacteriales bacterium]